MSNYNPYAYTSPQSPPQPARPAAGAPQPWQIGEVIGHAWRMFKVSWPTLVFTQFLSGLLGGIPNYVPGILVATHAVELHTSEYWTIYSVCILLGLIVTTFFTGGMVKVWCAAARGQTPEFGDMFAGGSRFLPLLATLFLTILAVLLGYVLLIVPGIILGLGVAFAQFYVVDQNMGPVDALKASWKATKGHKGNLFLFGLVAMLIGLAGYVACCIGVFVAIPLIMVAWATIYTRISGTATSTDDGPAPPQGGYGYYGAPGGYGGPPGGPPGYGPPGGSPGGFGGPPPAGFGGPPPGGFGGPPR